jgi:hypothetical protein
MPEQPVRNPVVDPVSGKNEGDAPETLRRGDGHPLAAHALELTVQSLFAKAI